VAWIFSAHGVRSRYESGYKAVGKFFEKMNSAWPMRA
jgi:hypothetical protein